MATETAALSLKLSASAQEASIPALIQKADPTFASRFEVEVNPLITNETKAAVAAKIATSAFADARLQAPVFGAWYHVKFNPVSDTARLSIVVEEYKTPDVISDLVAKLLALEEVESVHALHAVRPPLVFPDDDPISSTQNYLDAAPGGVDARYAWTVGGGDGSGADVVDLEQGWWLGHADLNGPNINLISGTNTAFFDHGTGVLGILGMLDNTIGGVGIAPSSRLSIVSAHGQPNGYSNASAILSAVTVLNPGDVILLEAQTGQGGPIETELDSFEAIFFATQAGITVIEAGGNGSVDLDTFRDTSGRLRWNRSSPDFTDSGAVVVGAGTSSTPHQRHGFSTFGSRVDVYAWGDSIVTTSPTEDGQTSGYTSGFNGTSGASAIVAGVAGLCQAIAFERIGSKLSPARAREVLRTAGTPSFNPAADKIGNMPNLRGIIDGGYLGRA